MSSGLTLLRTDEAPEERARWSYVLLSEELRNVVKEPKRDVPKILSRYEIQRGDLEHRRSSRATTRSSRKIATDGFLPPMTSRHAPWLRWAVATSRWRLAIRFANAKNALSQHTRFSPRTGCSQGLGFGDDREGARNMYHAVRAQGVTEKDGEIIPGAFVYAGFSH